MARAKSNKPRQPISVVKPKQAKKATRAQPQATTKTTTKKQVAAVQKTPTGKKPATAIKTAPPAYNYALIVNPISAAGKTKDRVATIEAEMQQANLSYKIFYTERPGHATEIARSQVNAGIPYIVAVGGDGTVSEVAAGFFDTKCQPLKNAPYCALGIITTGSGSDLARSLKIPYDFKDNVKILKTAFTRSIDMGMVKYSDAQGRMFARPFINIADVGIGGEVVEILEKQGKRGGWLAYQLATFKGLLRYKNKRMKITLDDSHVIEGITNGVIVANGKYFGSGMMIAPGADLSDGYFDVVIIGDISRLKTIMQARAIRKGTHVKLKEISVFHARKVTVESQERALLDVDGELPGQCPAEFYLLPDAIRVISP